MQGRVARRQVSFRGVDAADWRLKTGSLASSDRTPRAGSLVAGLSRRRSGPCPKHDFETHG